MKKQLGQGAPPAFATAMICGFDHTFMQGAKDVAAKEQSSSAKVTNV